MEMEGECVGMYVLLCACTHINPPCHTHMTLTETPECVDDDMCPSGMECVDYKCEPCKSGTHTRSHSSKKSRKKTSRTSETPECMDDDMCPSGMECVDYKCEPCNSGTHTHSHSSTNKKRGSHTTKSK